MKKTIAMLLALVLALCALCAAADPAGDAEGIPLLGPTGKMDDPLHGSVGAWSVEGQTGDYDAELLLQAYVRDLTPMDPGYDGDIPAVYCFTVAWEAVPGVFTRTADAYEWDCDALTYTRTAAGEWDTDTYPELHITLENRSNCDIQMCAAFEPAEGVDAVMDSGMNDCVTAGTADGHKITLASESRIRDDDFGGESEPFIPWFEKTGEETSAEMDLEFWVISGFGCIEDSIGTVTLEIGEAAEMNPQAVLSLLQ